MKLVMTDSEKRYFQKLPKALREKIARALDQPDVIPPDRRRSPTHWAEKRALRCYVVKFEEEAKPHQCTLEQAAALVGWSPKALDDQLEKLSSRRFGPRALSVFAGHGEATVSKVKPH